MTLRLRLFLLVAGLVALLVLAQALLVRSLAARLDRDAHTVAITVGEEILSGFAFESEAGGQKVESDFLFVRTVNPNAMPKSPDGGATSGAPGKTPHAPGGGPDGSAEGAKEGTWIERRRVELLTEDLRGAEPRRYFEERVTVGGVEPRFEPRLEPSTGADRLLPMKRPEVVPDGQGALLLRGPRLERRISLPRQPFASTLDRFGSELTIGSLVLLTLGLAAAALVAHRITRPLGELASAAKRVGGELGLAVPVERSDELGAALQAFNAMSSRLATLDRENRRLAESEHLSELAEVARGLAHTLRNPLNALGLAVEELAERGDSPRARELGERSRRQIRRIDGSLRSFLALASAPAASPETVELGALAREVALEALQDAAGRVRVEVEAPEPIALVAVAAEVKAVVQALLVNACDASPEAGRVVVRVGRDAGAGVARVEIDDEGAGIAPAVAERLYAPHVTTKPNGSGMGLYLAQRLATHRYGGGVTLAPLAVGGTRATLTLGDRSGAAA